MLKFIFKIFLAVLTCSLCLQTFAQRRINTSVIAHNGWASNSVNTVIFRKNSLVTFDNIQYAAYYDAAQYVVLAKRKTGGTKWQVQRTPYKADATDAHKSISIMVDGKGYLHVAWGHHNEPLNYAKSVSAGSLQLTGKMLMTGIKENKVSYPEFYSLPDGDILFLYRDGGSGNGNLMMNRYQVKSARWERLQDNLIDGEGQRNAYWQMAIDAKGTIHLSWVWRETPDVASNHDMCYARSYDGGITWQKSTGERYTLPITANNAEYAWHITQGSELINQTSMFADAQGNPFIATYWREQGDTIPQYHLVYKANGQWKTQNLGFRKSGFSLSGTGTRRIPISRPQVIAWKMADKMAAAIIFRDEERSSKVSVAVNNDITGKNWQVIDLSPKGVGSWEPTYDTELWRNKGIFNLFVQNVTQVDAEGNAGTPPTLVSVIEWNPRKL